MNSKPELIPFHIFLWKISSRCNLNCDYCYVYNSVDSSWQSQPRFMSADTAQQTAIRIRQHCEEHGIPRISINFHGGEPLLGGVEYLEKLISIIDSVFRGSQIEISLGLQSNGTLFTKEIANLLLKERISMGISIDGPPEVHDLHRVDHRGNPRASSPELSREKGVYLC